MSRPLKEKEPLIVVPVRLPANFVEQLDAEARAENKSRSDVLRERISNHKTGKSIEPTGKPAPQKRERLLKATKADPVLLSRLAAIGNNANQIARQVNSGALSGKKQDAISVLIVLESIERQLKQLAKQAGAGYAD